MHFYFFRPLRRLGRGTLLPLLLPGLAAGTLSAGELTLEHYLNAAAASETAAALRTENRLQTAQKSTEVLSEGLSLYGELDYAEAKGVDRREAEYHVAAEKSFLTGDSGAYLDALKLSEAQRRTLAINRFKGTIAEYYITACALREKIWLQKDAFLRNRQLTALIRSGVDGGEFDRSALLRSELVTDELKLDIEGLESAYAASLHRLHAAAATPEGDPTCSDLPKSVPAPSVSWEGSPLFARLDGDIAAASAMKRFRDTPLPNVTLGAGYDDEMDVRRGLVYIRIPLQPGSRLTNEREAARLAQLNADRQLRTARTRMAAEVLAYENAQEVRRGNLQRLNDHMIPKAYESTVLLEERFIGSEGSYLAYIDSQKALFELLKRGVDTLYDALLAQNRLHRTLGIDPQKEAE